MNDAALRNLIRCKLELAHTMIGLLPETLHEPIHNSEKEFLRSLSEAVNDYLKDAANRHENNPSKDKGVRAIEIEG